MRSVTPVEMVAVLGVGYLLAEGTTRIPYLNERKVLTRTLLYTLGYFLATRVPETSVPRISESRP